MRIDLWSIAALIVTSALSAVTATPNLLPPPLRQPLRPPR